MNKDIDKIIQLYQGSLDDWAFSRTEKRDIQQCISQANLEKDDIGYIRRKIFDLAKERLSPDNAGSLFDWAERATQALMSSLGTAKSINNEVFFSPGKECKAAILRQLEQAKQQLAICVFTITDNVITEAIEKCFKKGVQIKIITDNDKSCDLGSDIKQLAHLGVTVRTDNTDNHMHHKFAVFDNTTVITGSYNWTRSASRFNQENLLSTNEPKLVDRYRQEFSQLWPKMTPYSS